MTIYHINARVGMSLREALATVSDQMKVGDQIRVSWPDGLRETATAIANEGFGVKPEWLEIA